MRRPFVTFLISLLVQHAVGQERFRPAASAAGAGFSEARLQRIDSFFNAMINDGRAPNAITFVARNGQVVHHRAYGYRNMEKRVPTTPTDLFRIASQTKLVTTIALLMLYEEGKLFLDDPIAKYLPEFADVQVLVSYDKHSGQLDTRPPKSAPTIRQLLSHTTGIPYDMAVDSQLVNGITDLDFLLDLTTAQVVAKLAIRPLLHDPGTAFTYGFNTDVVGRIVEVIAQQTLDDFFAQRIFAPLGMSDTHFYLPEAKHSRLLELYAKADLEGQITVSGEEANRLFPIGTRRKLYLGGEGLVSTAEDYAKLLQLILNGGSFNGVRLLSRKTVDLMCRNQIGELELSGRRDKFGLGFQIITENSSYGDLASVGSLTWGGAYCSEFTVDPEERLVLLVFSNVFPYAHYEEFVRTFRVLVYQALE